MIDIVILYFHLSSDSFFKRGDIFEYLTALFHSKVKNFELVLNILIFFLNLPTQLLNQFWMLHKFLIDCCENSSLKYFGVIGNHQGYFFDFDLILSLIGFDFIYDSRWLKDTFLYGSKDLLYDLTDFGLHFKPFEFLYFEL